MLQFRYLQHSGYDQEVRDIVKNTFFYSFFDEESEIPDGQAETGAVSRSFPQAEAGADTEIASSQICYLPDYAGCRKSVVLRPLTSSATLHSTANPAPRNCACQVISYIFVSKNSERRMKQVTRT